MDIKPGSRWSSAVCDTEVIAVQVPSRTVVLECGGSAMVPHGSPGTVGASPDEAFSGGTQLGKRYADEGSGIEVLCTKAGAGSLSVDGVGLSLKDAKALPASD